MIFRNPSGAPELACNACGCRWFDRTTDECYECGEPVPAEQVEAFTRAVEEWQARRASPAVPTSGRTGGA